MTVKSVDTEAAPSAPPGAGSGRGGRGGLSRFERRRRVAGVAFVAPALVFVLALFLVPLAMTVWMSTYDWHLLRGGEFTGLENYGRMLEDGQFWSALWFTTKFTVITTVLTFGLGFGLALLVRRSLFGVAFLRTSYFLPVVVGYAVASYIFVWLFNDQVGVVNPFLTWLGVLDRPIQWLSESNTALAALVTMTVWKVTGFAMLVLLVGLQAVPEELYEAATVDGAGKAASLRYITLPLLRPTFALVFVFLVTQFYLGFDQFFIMTQGGPRNTTITVVYWIFNNAFVGLRLGYGAALAIVLLALLILINGVQFFAIRKDPTR